MEGHLFLSELRMFRNYTPFAEHETAVYKGIKSKWEGWIKEQLERNRRFSWREMSENVEEFSKRFHDALALRVEGHQVVVLTAEQEERVRKVVEET